MKQKEVAERRWRSGRSSVTYLAEQTSHAVVMRSEIPETRWRIYFSAERSAWNRYCRNTNSSTAFSASPVRISCSEPSCCRRGLLKWLKPLLISFSFKKIYDWKHVILTKKVFVENFCRQLKYCIIPMSSCILKDFNWYLIDFKNWYL